MHETTSGRRRKLAVKVLAVLGGTLAVLGGIGYVVFMIDESPPDDRHLRVVRPTVPDEQNGSTYLLRSCEAYQASASPSADAGTDPSKKLGDILAGKAWDAVLAADLLENNREALDLLDKALACPHLLLPQCTDINAKSPLAEAGMAIAQLMDLRACALMRAGREEDALEQSLRLVALGRRIQSSKGTLVDALVGLSIMEMGCERVRRIAAAASIPADRLWSYGLRLGELTSGDEGLADVLRGVYAFHMATVEGFQRGDFSMKYISGGNPEEKRTLYQAYVNRPWNLKINQTRRWFVEAADVTLYNLGRPLSEMRARPLPWREDWGTFGRLWGGNVFGKYLYALLAPSVSGVQEAVCQVRTDAAATRVVVAIRCFTLRTGRLPTGLEELVPDYFASVPTDAYDGRPLRYSAAKRLLYSVGKDLTDEGGFTEEEGRAWFQKEHESWAADDPDEWAGQIPDPSWSVDFRQKP